MRVEKDLSKMTKIAENEKYDFYVRKFGKTDWYAYAMEKGTNIAVILCKFFFAFSIDKLPGL